MNKTLFQLGFIALMVGATAPANAQVVKNPKLILQITVDQLRGDLPYRYYDRLSEGGFRYLIENGTVYRNAHHPHANTETIVGHTTLATGATPALHGMVGNVWLDRVSGEFTYNVEDPRYPIVGSGAGVDQSTEIDPTQRTARSDGRSPSRILVSTFSDELNLSQGGKAKVFGVSVKDRGAISMAGHTGKAFWFSKAAERFITSGFYYDEYPEWVNAFNDEGPVKQFENTSWELMHAPEEYLFIDQDDRPFETTFPGFGRIFPHPFGKSGEKYFSTFLTMSPAGDKLVLDFAKELVLQEGLGDDDKPDYLSVSFSSTDYVGHIFGPSSLEAEDNILQLDRTLSNLLDFIDTEVGLDETLVVLSADHGGAEAPGYLAELGFEASYISPEEFDKDGAFDALKTQFGLGEELLVSYFHPYLYLNRALIAEKGLDLKEVEAAVAEEVSRFEGVALALSTSALIAGEVPDNALTRAVMNNHNPNRSGDVYLVFDANRFINDFDGLEVATTHGSPWRYDTFVPIIFAGADMASQQIYDHVETTAVAPTLSLMVGAKLPSGSEGRVLTEVFHK